MNGFVSGFTLCCFGVLFGFVLWQDLNVENADHSKHDHSKHSSHGTGFRFSTSVSLFRHELTTSSLLSFSLACLLVFAMALFTELLKVRSMRSSRVSKSLQHVAQVTLAYLVSSKACRVGSGSILTGDAGNNVF